MNGSPPMNLADWLLVAFLGVLVALFGVLLLAVILKVLS